MDPLVIALIPLLERLVKRVDVETKELIQLAASAIIEDIESKESLDRVYEYLKDSR